MYKRILVPLDGSAAGERGLQEAIGLAAVHHAELVLLNVVEDYPAFVEIAPPASVQEMRMSLRRRGEDLLDAARQRAQAGGVQAATRIREVVSERVADAIVEETEACGCDLIVMGTHGRRGWRRLMLGSDAASVLHMARTPVLLVRPPSGGAAR